MTEEDAKQFTKKTGEKAIHIAVKAGTKIMSYANKKTEMALAAGIGYAMEKIENRTRVYQGPNALKKFIAYDKNSRSPIGRIDVDETDFKEFAKMCKKNGVDFAIVKDKVDENTVHFFFSGKNAEVMAHLFEQYAKEKYQQDIKNEMMPDEEQKDMEKAAEKDLEEQVEPKEFKPKERVGKGSLHPEKAMDDAEKLDTTVPMDKSEVATEKAKEIKEAVDEMMEDIDLPERPEMER
nr:PcfB family protein [uncultured Butyrivibrio sp.]